MILKHFSLFGLVLSGVMAIAGHFSADPALSPSAHTISDFAAADRGGLVEFAMGLAALSTCALLPSLRRFGRLAVGLLTTWSVALMVATVIATDPVGEPLGTMGYIHRYASAVAFAALLAAGLRLAQKLPWRGLSRTIRGLSAAGLTGAVAMLASTYVFDRIAIGVAERVMAFAELAILVAVAARISGITQVARPLAPALSVV
jgi:hypothetical protein